MAALPSVKRSLEGSSCAAAGGIEKQPHQDRAVGKALPTESSEEPGTSRESTQGVLDIMDLNSGPYGEVGPLSGGDSGVLTSVGFLEGQYVPSDGPGESLLGVKGIK